MKPLISKVRPGDILLGTRNLRAYLQTVSLYRILTHNQGPRKRHNGRYAGPKLYIPSKQDSFVVAANTSECFATWCSNQNVVLLFINPVQSGQLPKSIEETHSFSNFVAQKGVDNQTTLRMSPNIFSSWFMKTRFKKPDLREWPGYAYHMHACFHLGLVRRAPGFRSESGGLSFTVGEDQDNEFMISEWNESAVNKPRVREMAENSRVRGHLRNSVQKGALLIGRATGVGPRLRDISTYRSLIQGIIKGSQSYKRTIKEYPDNSLVSVLEKLVAEIKSSDTL